MTWGRRNSGVGKMRLFTEFLWDQSGATAIEYVAI
jgi:hypothetical protein